MFCPRCKSEYRKGFETCSDCNIPLVDELPVETTIRNSKTEIEYTEYELIFSTIEFTNIALIESIFDSEGIIYYIQGEDIGVAPGGLPARVLVKKEQVEEAKQLLKDFDIL